MSTQVDERVVSMQFDNRHFEKNVSQSMSTLDKLKQKLNLDGATKGLQSVDSAARKVDMSGLGNAVETVRSRFSALEVMGVTALANITNSAVNAAKRMVNALTIAPIGDGFKEYEMTLNAVQTTMAGTGKTAQEVEKELKKLDEYADKTVYSTSDMLNNLPKFTNAGVLLEDATKAMIGIANATALAGGDAGKASIAFYNLGQAIGTGYLTRMDYNSINNAGIATMEWKEQMVKAAIAAGTLKKAGEDAYVAGGKTFTMQQLFIDGLQKQWATTDVMMTVFGKYGDALDEDVGKKAYAAAQDIKTFSMMMDSLKATAGTGWKDTWQIMFGGLDAAKEFWTGLNNAISGVITKMADFRNTLLGNALKFDPWSKLMEKIDDSGLGKVADTAKKVTDTVGKFADKIQYFQDVVNKVWRGDYNNRGDNPDRFYLLEKAGYNPKVVQNLVNLGYKHKITQEDIAEAYKKAGVAMDEAADSAKKNAEATENADKAISGLDAALENLNDEELKNLGFNEEEIRMLRELQTEAKRLGVPIDELLNKMKKSDGRTLLIDSLKNAGSALVGVFKAMKEAWNEIFPPISSVRLYTIIDAIHTFSEKLRLTNAETGELNATGEKFKRTFKGVFAIIDLVATVIGTVFKKVVELTVGPVGKLGGKILDTSASVGDMLVAFRDWVKENQFIEKGVNAVADAIEWCIDKVKGWIETIKNIPGISTGVDKIKSSFENLKNIDLKSVGGNIIDGLSNGLSGGLAKIWETVKGIGLKIIEVVCKVLGIESPSKVFMTIGGFIIAGLVLGVQNGLKDGFGSIGTAIKGLCSKMVDSFGNFDWSNISNIFMQFARLFPKARILTYISAIGSLINIGGKDVMRGLAEGLGQGASLVWTFMTTIAEKIVSLFNKKLEINSPSKVFMAIGGFLIAGLILGIQNGLGGVKDTIVDFGNNLNTWFRQIDFGSVIAAGFGVGILLLVNKITDTIGKVLKPVEAFGSMCQTIRSTVYGVGEAIKDHLKAKKFKTISKSILNLAIAIGILAVSVAILTKVDQKNLWSAVGALGVLTLVVVGMAIAAEAISKKIPSKGDSGIINSFAVTMVGMAASLVLIAIAMKQLSSIGADKIPGVLKLLAGIVVGLFVLLIAIEKIISWGGAEESIKKLGRMMLSLSVALLIMTMVVKRAAKMSGSEIGRGLAFVVGVGLLFSAITLLTRSAGRNAAKAGGMLLMMSGAMLIMVGVVKMAAKMSSGEVKRGLKFVADVELLFAAVIVASAFAGQHAVKAGGMLLMMAGAILIMTISVKALAKLSDAEIARGLLIVAGIEAIFAGIIYMSKFAGEHAAKAGTMLITMSGALLIIVGALFVLSSLSPDKLWASIGVIAILEALFGGLIFVTKYAQECKSTLIVLTVVIGLLAGALVGLSFIDPVRLGTASASLSLMIGVFTLLMLALNRVEMNKSKIFSSIGTLGALAAVALAFAGVLVYLSQCNSESALPSVLALSALVVAMTGVMLVVSKIKEQVVLKAVIGVVALTLLAGSLYLFALAISKMPDVSGAVESLQIVVGVMVIMSALLLVLTLVGLGAWAGIIGVGALTLLAGSLYAFAFVISKLPDITSAEDNLILLLKIMGVMTALLVPLTLIGLLAPMAFAGILALTSMVTPLSAFAIALAILPDVSGAQANVDLLVGLLDSMADVLVKLAPMGPLAVIATAALYLLTPLMIAFGGFAMTVGAFMTWIPQLEAFLSKGISVLTMLAYGLGATMGAFIAGFSAAVLTVIPMIGKALSDFWFNVQFFVLGVQTLNDRVLKGVGIMTAAILALTAAAFLSGITKILSLGQSSLPMLGLELGLFMLYASPFIIAASRLDEKMMSGVKMLSEAIMLLTASALIDGVSRFFGAGASLSQFALQLPALAQGISGFITDVGPVEEADVDKAAHVAGIIKTLAEAAKSIPNSGGWLGTIIGNNDIGTWGAQLSTLATGVSGFITTISSAGISKDSVDLAGYAADIIVKLADAASKIPNDGGWLGVLVGENNIGTFGDSLPTLAEDIVKFANAVKDAGLTQDSVTQAQIVGDIIVALASAAENIPNTGGWLASIVGDNDLKTWSESLPTVGSAVKDFATNVGTFDDATYQSVWLAVRAIEAIASLTKDNTALTTKGDFKSFGNGMVILGEKLKSFVSHVSEIGADALDGVVTKISKIIELAKTIASTNIEGCKTFGASLKSIGEEAVNGFVNAFADKDPVTRVTNAAKALMDALIKGAEAKEDSVIKAFEAIAKAADDKIATKDRKREFEQAGKDLGDGLIKGIEAKEDAVYWAGYALGQKAVQGEKDGQQSKSPSKLTEKAGKWLGEGLIIGINKMDNLVYKSGYGLGETATNTISAAISRISDVVNSDIDAQPTIRPVLDLSDVESGASAIGSMFSGRTLAVNAAGVGSISASMNARQNGATNDDVVSAIKLLRKDIAGMPRDAVNINGITYSGDSDINNAVQQLVRAVRIEGRV